MYYFAVPATETHTNLYLIQLLSNGQSKLWITWQDGRTVGHDLFVPSGLADHLWVKEYNGDPKDISETPYKINEDDCLDISPLLNESLLIPASATSVQKLRDFIAYTKQYSTVLDGAKMDCGAMPVYYTSGRMHGNGHLRIDPKREMKGVDPCDLRGPQTVTTSDNFMKRMTIRYDRSDKDGEWARIKNSFSRNSESDVRLVRTNCIVFALTVLHQYCGIDLNAIYPDLQATTQPVTLQTIYSELYKNGCEFVSGSDFSASISLLPNSNAGVMRTLTSMDTLQTGFYNSVENKTQYLNDLMQTSAAPQPYFNPKLSLQK